MHVIALLGIFSTILFVPLKDKASRRAKRYFHYLSKLNVVTLSSKEILK